jgi:hypothetical protein
MSIAFLYVRTGYSNGKGWFEGRLRKGLSWKGMALEAPFDAQGKQGKQGILWFATAVEKCGKVKAPTYETDTWGTRLRSSTSLRSKRCCKALRRKSVS